MSDIGKLFGKSTSKLGSSPFPYLLPLVAGGLMLGSGSANLVYMNKSSYNGGTVSDPKSLKVFNIIIMCLGILLILISFIPTAVFAIKRGA
jgi:hypothetical protein